MKIKLPRTKKKIIVDENRGIVTTLLIGVDNQSLKFVGVAKCSPEDIFDPEIGKKISYKRARRQMFVEIRRQIREEIEKGENYAKIHQEIYDDLTSIIEELKQSTYDCIK